MMDPINILVEGETDAHVAMRLLKHLSLEVGTIYGKSGKAHLLKQLPKYNQAARFNHWFVIVDLDNETLCASQAIRQWLPDHEEGMLLRVAVQAIESWLLADVEHFASFLAVSMSRFPDQPDLERNPKERLVNIARSSRKRDIRDDFVPRQGSGSKVGPLYTARLVQFVQQAWRPEVAIHRSDSLKRCIAALERLR
jgi:predicted ATP-dependent endonuclease of OLD family